MLPKEFFIKACNFQPVDRPPVWIMRQAGRTLKEYLELREKYSFWQICKTPELAAQVTLQPLKRFPLDAAIIFSDILVIPEALGMEVQFNPKLFLRPLINDVGLIRQLDVDNVTKKLSYVADALRLVYNEVGNEKAILGFSGAPFTLACYMIEGGSSKDFLQVKEMMFHHPQVFYELMECLTLAITDYLLMQYDASVTAVQLFDTWAGILNPDDYYYFVLPYVKKIIENLKKSNPDIPVIYYINGISSLLKHAGETGADVIGVDWRINLSEVRKILGNKTVVQGNLDPTILLAPKEVIRKRVFQMLDMTGGEGHIVNLGHGLLPVTPISGIETFVNAVHDWAVARQSKEVK